MTVAFIATVVAVLLFWSIKTYNRLVTLKNRVSNGFAQIDVQLKRRHDLIPNLIEVARKYMSFERDTLEAVVTARNRAVQTRVNAAGNLGSAEAISALGAAEGALGGSLDRLFAVSENYPELKANLAMAQLSEELTSTENKVGFARQSFNDAVMDMNTAIASFPTVLFSGALGYRPAALLESIEKPPERAAPQVKF